MKDNKSKKNYKNEFIINRAKHKQNFTVITNHLIKDERINVICKGIMLMILSNSDKNFVLNLKVLQPQSGIGKVAFYNATDKLQELGYLNKQAIKSGVRWTVNEIPSKNGHISISTIPENGNRWDAPTIPELRNPKSRNPKNGYLINNNASTDVPPVEPKPKSAVPAKGGNTADDQPSKTKENLVEMVVGDVLQSAQPSEASHPSHTPTEVINEKVELKDNTSKDKLNNNIPKVEINDNKPKVEINNYTPKVETDNHTPKVETENHTPKVETDNHTPKVETDNHTPKVETDNHTPKGSDERSDRQYTSPPPKYLVNDISNISANTNTQINDLKLIIDNSQFGFIYETNTRQFGHWENVDITTYTNEYIAKAIIMKEKNMPINDIPNNTYNMITFLVKYSEHTPNSKLWEIYNRLKQNK